MISFTEAMKLLNEKLKDLKQDQDRYLKLADIDDYYNKMFMRAVEKTRLVEEIINDLKVIYYED